MDQLAGQHLLRPLPIKGQGDGGPRLAVKLQPAPKTVSGFDSASGRIRPGPPALNWEGTQEMKMTRTALIPDDLIYRLQENGRASLAERDGDHPPIVKLFTPDGRATWLLTELDPHDPDLAFGLCDLGHGYPELGYVRLSEILEISGYLSLSVERDVAFRTEKPISYFAELASAAGRILT